MIEEEEEVEKEIKVEKEKVFKEYKKFSRKVFNKVAFKLSRIFRFVDLKEATKYDEHEIREYIKIQYPKISEKLINKNVIHRALYYCKKSFKPEIIKAVHGIELDDVVYSKIILKETITLIYEDVPFKSCIIVSNGELKDVLFPIIGDPYQIYGYWVGCDVSYVHWSMLGWVKYDQPAFLIEHAFGKNEMLLESIASSKKIDKIMKEIMMKTINYLEAKESSVENRIDRAYREADHFHNLFDHSWKQLKTERDMNVQRDLTELREQRKERYDEPSKMSIIATIILVALLVGLGLWFVFSTATIQPPTNSTNNETGNNLILILLFITKLVI